MDKVFIGIGYKARQGKNEVASAIQQAFPRDVTVLGFADALKVYCRVQHGMTTKDAPLLQRVGEEMRQKDPNFWVNILRWTATDRDERYILIPDLRHHNEVEFCKASGVVIEVCRWIPGSGRFVAQDRDPNHISETALDGYGGWDYLIANYEGDRRSLQAHAIHIFSLIRSRYERS